MIRSLTTGEVPVDIMTDSMVSINFFVAVCAIHELDQGAKLTRCTLTDEEVVRILQHDGPQSCRTQLRGWVRISIFQSVTCTSTNSRSTDLNSCLSAFAASFAALSIMEARSQSSKTSVQSSDPVAVR